MSAVELKPPTTIEEQVEILKSRGLDIHSEARALEILSHINYYRLSAYLLPFRKSIVNPKDSKRKILIDEIREGISIEDIYTLYEFDKLLRGVLRAVLEDVEIVMRRHVAYVLAHEGGALAHADSRFFADVANHAAMCEKIREEIERSKELYVKHHKEKYSDKFPVWVTVELMSFTMLSKLYSNLHGEFQDKVAMHASAPKDHLISWLQGLSVFRNICAHHGRLYYRGTNSRMRLTDEVIGQVDVKYSDRAFYAFYVSKQILPYWLGKTHMEKLNELVSQYEGSVVKPHLMGFPENWRSLLGVV